MHRCTNADSAGTGAGAFDASVAIYRAESLPSYASTQARVQEANCWQEELSNIVRHIGVSLNTDSETIAQMRQVTDALVKRSFAFKYGMGVYTVPSGSTVQILPGIALDSSMSDYIIVSTMLDMSINDLWSAGGLRPSAITLADATMYNLFVIKNPTSGAVSAGLDTSPIATNLLADASGYTKYRRVGIFAVYDDSGTKKPRSMYSFGNWFVMRDVCPYVEQTGITTNQYTELILPLPDYWYDSSISDTCRIIPRVNARFINNVATGSDIDISDNAANLSTTNDGAIQGYLPASGRAFLSGLLIPSNGTGSKAGRACAVRVQDASANYDARVTVTGWYDNFGIDYA